MSARNRVFGQDGKGFWTLVGKCLKVGLKQTGKSGCKVMSGGLAQVVFLADDISDAAEMAQMVSDIYYGDEEVALSGYTNGDFDG